MKNLIAAMWAIVFCVPTVAAQAETPAGVELRTGLDAFGSRSSTIQGLHGITVLWDFGNYTYAGQSFYSAALGDAGGAFFWGYEVAKDFPINDQTALSLQGFIGGGGGAGEVPGDGLMTRAYGGGVLRVSDQFAVNLGASYVRIQGSPVDTLSYMAGINYRPGGWPGRGRPTENNVVQRLSAIRPSVRAFEVDDGRRARNGSRQESVTLSGAEIAFRLTPASELFINADGAVRGDGEGYMNVLGGYRYFLPVVGDTRLFADTSIGFGGGGDIDTGAGLLLAGGVGAELPLSESISIMAGVQRVQATSGDFGSISPYLRASINLGNSNIAPRDQARRRWRLAYSTSITSQFANADFRKPGNPSASNPVLNATAIDLFVTDDLYITGEAQTVMYGDAGGYALGILGAGYKIDMAPRWDFSVEMLIGAAGGGGVATNGGLIGGVRAEIDYALADNIHLYGGAGYLQAIKGGETRMAPVTAHAGIKVPFEVGG